MLRPQDKGADSGELLAGNQDLMINPSHKNLNTELNGPCLQVDARLVRQMLKLVEKGADGGEVIERDLMPVRFVPLHDVPAKRPPAAQAGAGKPPPGASAAEL